MEVLKPQEPHQPQQLHSSLLVPAPVLALHLQGKGDVPDHGPPGHEGGILEDVANLPARMGEHCPVNTYLALVCRQQASQDTEECGLAAA